MRSRGMTCTKGVNGRVKTGHDMMMTIRNSTARGCCPIRSIYPRLNAGFALGSPENASGAGSQPNTLRPP
jgi:hypothetical protein